MTPPRRAKNQAKASTAYTILALVAGLVLGGLSFVAQAATTGRVVTDRHTGLALYGVDPVGYFTDGKPLVGREEFEYRFSGAVWRFDNEGNRAAFAADPAVYMPRFGGYDPAGIARGVATPGFPQLWTVFRDRLYLFYTAQARTTFIADPAAAILAADAKWDDVARELPE
jgi:hypothetical protein